MIVTISDHISNIKRLVNDMIEERKKANMIEDSYKMALAYEKRSSLIWMRSVSYRQA